MQNWVCSRITNKIDPKIGVSELGAKTQWTYLWDDFGTHLLCNCAVWVDPLCTIFIVKFTNNGLMVRLHPYFFSKCSVQQTDYGRLVRFFSNKSHIGQIGQIKWVVSGISFSDILREYLHYSALALGYDLAVNSLESRHHASVVCG